MNENTNNSTTAAATRELALSSMGEVAPGANGILHHQVSSETAILDLTHDPSVEIVSLNAGKTEIKKAPDQIWSDALALAGASVAAGTYITIVARNVGDESKTLKLVLIVEEHAQVVAPEEAPAVQRQFGRPATSPGTSTGSARTQNTPFVRGASPRPQSPTTQSPDSAPKRNVVRSVLAPIAQRNPSAVQATRATGGPVVSNKPNGKSRVNPPRILGATPPPPARTGAPKRRGPVASARKSPVSTVSAPVRPANVSRAPSQLLPARSATQEIVPNEGEHAVSILFGHAERLLLRVDKHVVLPKTFKPALTRVLSQAIGHTGSRMSGGSDVVFCLSVEDIQALMKVVHYGGVGLQEPQRTRVANAIRLGLATLRSQSKNAANGVTEDVPALPLAAADPEVDAAAASTA